MTTLPVSEVFGPTIQGEGPHTGRRCSFVRLGLCNLSCEWCDTPFTWDHTRFDVKALNPPTTIEDVHARLDALGPRMVVLSGGEPLIHARHFPELLAPRFWWHIETNGTIAPGEWMDRVGHVTVSPKINTRDPLAKRIVSASLRAWEGYAVQGLAAFKFVVSTMGDFDTIADLCRDHGIAPGHVWVMPEGTDADTVLDRHRVIVDTAVQAGYNTSTRLHTLLWGNERAR